MIATYAVTALDGLAFGMALFVVAAGLTLIYGVMGVLNLAHGSLYLVGAYLAATKATGGGLLALVLVLAASVLLGAGGGAALDRLTHTIRPSHLDQALLTVGISLLASDALATIFGSAPQSATPPDALAGSVGLGVHGYPVYRLALIAVAAALATALHIVLRHTNAGIALRAVIADPPMAAASGIRTTRVRLIAFSIGGALAVAGGALGAPILGPAVGVDTTVLTLSLIVVVIGGTGGIPATLAASLLVGQVQTLGVITAPAAAPFALFAVMILVLVGRSTAQRRTA